MSIFARLCVCLYVCACVCVCVCVCVDRKKEERQGLGLLLNPLLSPSSTAPPEGVNDRLMMLIIPCSGKNKFLTLVSVYAPSMTNPEEIKDKFYEELNSIILDTPKSDKLYF